MKTVPYDLNVRFIKGLANQLADCLSRLGPLQDKIKLPIVQAHETTCRQQATANRIQLLHEATAKDEVLCSLKHVVQSNKVVFLWNRTLVAFVDKLSSTTVDFIRSEGELKNCTLYGL